MTNNHVYVVKVTHDGVEFPVGFSLSFEKAKNLAKTSVMDRYHWLIEEWPLNRIIDSNDLRIARDIDMQAGDITVPAGTLCGPHDAKKFCIKR